MTEASLSALVNCRLMHGIPEEEKLLLARELRATTKNHKSGSMVIQAGESCDYVIIVLRGQMKAEMIDSKGHVVKITDLLPPAVLAPAFLFGDQRHYPVTVTSAEDGSTIWIPREELLSLLMKDKRVLVNYLNILSNQGQFLAQKVHFHAFHTLRDKVLHYLIEQSKHTGSRTIRLRSGRAELAELFGVARPSLSRVMSELQREGLITISGKTIILEETL